MVDADDDDGLLEKDVLRDEGGPAGLQGGQVGHRGRHEGGAPSEARLRQAGQDGGRRLRGLHGVNLGPHDVGVPATGVRVAVGVDAVVLAADGRLPAEGGRGGPHPHQPPQELCRSNSKFFRT